jgi:DNA-binding response OmpR family regulator
VNVARAHTDRDRIDYLEAEVAQLRAMLGLELARERRVQLKLAFGLTPSEATLLGVLMNSRVMSKDVALQAMADPGRDEYPDDKIVDVLISKMRAKLAPHGIEIQTAWREGHRLPPAARAALEAALAEVPL